jgi:hypothetical protein
MTKQALAVPWPLQATREPRPSIIIAVSIVALLTIGAAAAKQQCNVEAGKQGSWSWRMIDDRKCWYQGKPMLSKAMLEWPSASTSEPDGDTDTASAAAPVSPRAESHGDPMDAQAYAPTLSPTFDARWRDRIEGSRN